MGTSRDKTTGQHFYTIRDFDRDFPTDEACLDWLRDFLYPAGIYCKICKKTTKHHRIKNRMSYSCDYCGHHEHPMSGTIFQDTRTPLRSWFHAVFLMASTRGGISAKQLQREIGVTYKTAWRMFRLIRSLLEENTGSLGGQVEVDEAYIGGKRRGQRTGRPGKDSNKTPVLGIVQCGGKVAALVTPDVSRATVMPIIEAKVLPRSMIYTDDYKVYNPLSDKGYGHRRIAHSEKVYVMGDVHTNTIEGFWSLLKNGIRGVYHSVSSRHLQSYINEYTFRYNHRSDEVPMFASMIGRVSKA
ncbi:MAG TPA: IS1595 family transposase [Dehalococcoidia bacterium]|nr:IS1595 family transposase [Dehalococcoidia bacterium]